MTLQDRFEPWHLLVVAAFLVGAGGSLLGGAAGFAAVDVLAAALSGLLWAFAVSVFVATFRNYVTSYVGTGGSLWDPRFLAPFVVGVVAAVALVVWRTTEGTELTASLAVGALSAGFWAFVIAMVLVLAGSAVVAGYREGAQ